MGRVSFLFIIPAVFLIDRFSKIWIMARYPEGGGFPVWRGILRVTRVNNTGAAFGIFEDAGLFLIAVSLAGIAGLSWYLSRLAGAESAGRVRPKTEAVSDGLTAKKSGFSRIEPYAASFVVAGALGNLVDRLSYGYVVDFLDFHVWPVFNVADVSICVGVGLLAVSFFGTRVR